MSRRRRALVSGTPLDYSKYRGKVSATTPPRAATNPASHTPTGSWANLLGFNKTDGTPETPLDWALLWAGKGVHVFPCEQHLGTPLMTDWYAAATTDAKKVIGWWSATPDADIGAAPGRSGHFILAVHLDEGGASSFAELEEINGPLEHDFSTENRVGDRFLWLKGSAYTSHHKLGPGIHVLGEGMRVFMPNSHAPHLHYHTEDEGAI